MKLNARPWRHLQLCDLHRGLRFAKISTLSTHFIRAPCFHRKLEVLWTSGCFMTNDKHWVMSYHSHLILALQTRFRCSHARNHAGDSRKQRSCWHDTATGAAGSGLWLVIPIVIQPCLLLLVVSTLQVLHWHTSMLKSSSIVFLVCCVVVGCSL